MPSERSDGCASLAHEKNDFRAGFPRFSKEFLTTPPLRLGLHSNRFAGHLRRHPKLLASAASKPRWFDAYNAELTARPLKPGGSDAMRSVLRHD
jgi:hypothetical protein